MGKRRLFHDPFMSEWARPMSDPGDQVNRYRASSTRDRAPGTTMGFRLRSFARRRPPAAPVLPAVCGAAAQTRHLAQAMRKAIHRLTYTGRSDPAPWLGYDPLRGGMWRVYRGSHMVTQYAACATMGFRAPGAPGTDSAEARNT